jgi:hypothetical protein
MSRNTATGNPLVKYYANLTPANSVDLCWGVAKATETSSVDGNNNVITEGKPFIDIMKPKVGDKISFDFKHALSQLNVQIDADIDVLSHSTSSLDNNTRIYVRSVTFEGFATKGSLDLNSDFSTSPSQTTPNWYDIAGTGKLSTDAVTIYDGRRDGKEGVENASAKNETPYDLNPAIVQSKAYTTVLPAGKIQYTSFDSDAKDPGVTNDAVNLFNSATAEAPVLVIPTQEDMKITIVYDVETADATLSGYLSDGKTRGSTIENAITQEIKLGDGKAMTLESGKKYTVRLHLGLTSVKFDAEVTNWVDADEADVDLPINAGTAAGTPMSFNFGSAAINNNTITISGLTPGNSVSVSRSNSTLTAPSVSPATIPADGKVVVTYGVTENNTVLDRVAGILTLTEKDGENNVVTAHTTAITINQSAHELGLATSSATLSGDTYVRSTGYYDFVLTSTAEGFTDWSDATITIKDADNVVLTAGTDYTWNVSTKTVTFTGKQPASGNSATFTITVKAGNATAEEIKVRISKS